MTESLYVVGVTGHRPDKLGGYGVVNPMRDRLVAKLERRLGEIRSAWGALRVVTGMALGFDQWVADACARLGIPFEAALPFRGQDSRWPEESRQVYQELLGRADKVTVVCPGEYSPAKMQLRNEYVVRRCTILIAAWDGTSGGTANCVKFAKKIACAWENLLPL